MMKRFIIAAALCIGAAVFAKAQEPADSATVAAATSLGDFVKQNVKGLESVGIHIDRAQLIDVLTKVLNDEPTGMSAAEANDYLRHLFQEQRQQANKSADTIAERKFVEEAAATAGAITLPSGTVLQVIEQGKGEQPTIDDVVMVRYEGKLSDGKVFDDHMAEAVEFPVGKLIPGFTEGLLSMHTGGKYRLIIPSSAGYGPSGIPGVIPPNSALEFVVVLEDILPKE